MTRANEITRRTFLSRGAVAGGAVVLGGAAGGLLTGCSSSTSTTSTTSSGGKPGVGSGPPVRGGTLTVGTIAEIDGFYPPNNHWDTNGFLYANAIYDPLMAIAADGTIVPYLAQSMTPNSTYDAWTLTLRPNVKFNDGSALTSAVVKANFDALKSSLLAGPALAQITGVTVPDGMTIVYQLEAPNPYFPAGLTTQVGYVVGEAMIKQVQSGTANATPVGTGPFVYSSWQPNDHFTATRNPNYWRSGLPYLDQITFKPIPDTTQREATLRTGGVDMLISSDANTIVNFQGQSGYQLVDSRTGVLGEPTVACLMLNMVTPPTNDLTIRQALAKSLNVTVLQKLFGAGFAKPLDGIFLPGSPYYGNTGYPGYDPSAARQLVAAYKAKHGTPSLELLTVTDPYLAKVVQVVQQMWNQVGFNVSVNEIQQANLITDFVTGEFQAATLAQFGAINPDLNYVWWSTTTISPIGSIGLNFTRMDDPVIEQAMLTGRHTTDQATRVKAYQTVNDQLAQQLPYLWLNQYLFSEVAQDRVQNFDNATLPSGKPQYSFQEGIFWPAQIWLAG